jgi:hypothetical protein
MIMMSRFLGIRGFIFVLPILVAYHQLLCTWFSCACKKKHVCSSRD